jgi:hypothetical protein
MASIRDELKTVFNMLPASRRALVPGFGKRLIKAVIASLLVTALGPPVWIAVLFVRGAWRGDAFEVIHNRLVWEDEFVTKWSLALIIAGSLAVGVFQEIAWLSARPKTQPPSLRATDREPVDP